MARLIVMPVSRRVGTQNDACPLDRYAFEKRKIPQYGLALLHALHFSRPDCKPLQQLTDSEWKSLLALCDASQLTLLLGHLCGASLPGWVRARIDRNQSDTTQRFERLTANTLEITDRLREQSIDFALLKGFSHSPAFTPDPRLRAQGDIDLWCRPDRVFDAKEALVGLGYRPFGKSRGRHLDPLIRETSWQWRGDYFDRDLPIPVDLHYMLWDEELERISGPAEHEIWGRRCTATIEDRAIPVLGPADSIAFAALHVMMHLLHGDLRLQRAWELAYVLATHSRDEDLWSSWQASQGTRTREVQVAALLLTDRWFGCGLPDLICEEAKSVSPDVLLWIERYAFSPIESLFNPNKDELWLSLAFLNSFRDQVHVFSRRLLPLLAAEKKIEEERESTAQKGRQSLLRSTFLLKRAGHHTRMLMPTCLQGLHWWWQRQRLGSDFLQFLLASVLFDFGEFLFFLLYNLYLIDKGYTEHFIGQVAAALTAGTFVGVLPAAAVARRLGLRRTLLIAIVGTAISTVLRAIVPWQPALLFTSFLNGLFMSFWAVLLPPTVAGLTNDRNRTLAFSLITSIGIGTGAFAGLVGGRLPFLLARLSPGLTAIASKRLALLVGSALAVLAVIPARRLTVTATAQKHAEKKVYPRSRFFYVFLTALFVWNLGTGGFNPFFNVYLSRRLHFTVERIGLFFSYGQMAQVFVILLAPVVVKRMGEVRSIAAMQVATAMMLGLLAVVTNLSLVGIAYVAYMCFQYMSEPCLFSMLMTRVAPPERSGASAMNFLVVSLAGIIAALAAGALFPRVGYGATLLLCAGMTAVAAGLFYALVRR